MQSSPGPTNDRDAWSAALPPPRDDEPPSLRRDILDEIADHLACAYNRELLRGASASEARERVRERFGDPAAVARRLWFDAMKGKIMAQRILIVTCAVVALASLALVGVVYQRSVLVQREALRAAQAAAERDANAQALQQEMLKQLRAMSRAIEHPRSPDWNPVKIKVVEGAENGSPLPRVSVSVSSNRDRSLNMNLSTDESGVADFGTLGAGYYTCFINRPFKLGSLMAQQSLTVSPGSDVDLTIVCPKAPVETAGVRVKCDWPADLKESGLEMMAVFRMHPIKQSGLTWKYDYLVMSGGPHPAPLHLQPNRVVFFGPGASLAEFSSDELEPNRSMGGSGLFPIAVLEAREEAIQAASEPDGTLSWACGSYELLGVRIMLSTERSGWGNVVPSYPANSRRNRLRRYWVLADARFENPASGHELPQEYWAHLADRFEIRPGRINEWTVPLPDQLIAKARKELNRLKEEAKANAKK